MKVRMKKLTVISMMLLLLIFFVPRVEAQVIVDIPDPGLEAAIRFWSGTPTGPIKDTDLLGMTFLFAYSDGITDLTGLEYCVDLEDLILSANNISDLGPLSGLTNLEYLSLHHNNIMNLGPLSGLTGLRELSLGYNLISGIGPLFGLPNLEYLSLHHNNISIISVLSSLINLEYLDLSSNHISNITDLSGLTSLQRLYLSNNYISYIIALSGLTSLQRLHLSNNDISYIGPLSGLTNLWLLNLTDTNISDIGPLSGLVNLRILHLSENNISDIGPLSGLTNLFEIFLTSNYISDIQPLVDNPGVDGEPDNQLDLRGNPLSYKATYTDIPILQSRGVDVRFDEPSDPGDGVCNIYGVFVGTKDVAKNKLGQFIDLRGDLDAQLMYNTFNNFSNFSDGRILIADRTTNPPEEISYDKIKESIYSFNMDSDDILVFYSASHGSYAGLGETTVTPGDELLALGEVAPNPEGLTDDELTKILIGLTFTNKWIFLAACHSGGFWGNGEELNGQDLDILPNIGLMAATAEGELAYAFYGQSLFTKALVRGLSDIDFPLFFLDADYNLDGKVSWAELALFVQYDPRAVVISPGTVVHEAGQGDPFVWTPDMWSPVVFTSEDFNVDLPSLINNTPPSIISMIDFDPDTLNSQGKGNFVTAYIELPEGYDVSDIDISSLKLNDSVPAFSKPVAIGDYDGDGRPDLMVKFDRQQVIEILGSGTQMVILTGQLSDGRSLAGVDFIRVIDNKEAEEAEPEFDWIMPEEFTTDMEENLEITGDDSVDTDGDNAFEVKEVVGFILFEASGIINELSPESFNSQESAFELACALNDVFTMLDEGMYFEVMVILEVDILERIDGYVNIGEPDENDWIRSIEGQALLYPLVTETIELLESLL